MFTSIYTSLLLPSLAAFLFISLTPIWKLRLKGTEPQFAILWILIGGITLNFISATMIVFFNYLADVCPLLGNIAHSFKETNNILSPLLEKALPGIKISSVSSLSIVLVLSAILFTKLWKKLSLKSYYEFIRARRDSLGQQGTLEDLFTSSVQNFMPIMINLKNRKVYIGWIIENKSPSIHKRETVPVFLMASGHRTEDTLEFILENDYKKIITSDSLDNDYSIEQLKHVIQISEIVSATPWLPEIYKEVNNNKPKGKKKTKGKKPKKN